MNNKKIVAGVLTGIAAGITIAILLNTKAGRETSRKLMKKGNRLTDDLKGKFGDFVDHLQGKVHGILK
jgi:gas vesicle protein